MSSSIENSEEKINIAWKDVRAFAARERLILFECSAKTGYNIKTIFETIANALAKNVFGTDANELASTETNSSINSIDRSWGCSDEGFGLQHKYFKRDDSSNELHDRFIPCKGCCYT